MPRDSNGNYSLPVGNPVITGTVISSAWANTTMADLGVALTASLDRNGEGGMLAPLELVAGNIGAPGLTWALETTSGFYRAGTGDFRFALAGADIIGLTAAGISANGSGLINLNASNISSGTLADARLSANVALKNAANVFTAAQTVTTSSSSQLVLNNTGSTRNAQVVYATSGTSTFRVGVDISTNNATNVYEVYSDQTGGRTLAVQPAGNVSINAPSSGTPLSITNPAGNYGINIVSAGTVSGIQISDSTRIYGIVVGGVSGQFDIRDNTAGSVRLAISSAGNITIGTPSSGNALAVPLGSQSSPSYSFTADPDTGIFGNGSNAVVIAAGGAAIVGVSSLGLEVTAGLGVGTPASGTTGEIRATNNITAFFSDMRLKTHLGPIEGALTKVMNLNGFYWEPNKAAQDLGYAITREVGVSAQDVKKVMPEVIKPAPINAKYMTLDYAKLVPLLIEAVKELNRKIEGLQ